MGIRRTLHSLLFGRRSPPTTPTPAQRTREQKLRDALLRCESLTEDEIEEYISYELHGVTSERVPLDYRLTHPDEDCLYLYSDGILQEVLVLRHKNPISEETRLKVQRVLQEVCIRPRESGRS